MKSRILLAAVAFLGYAILNATPANAADRFYVGNNTAWDTATNWLDGTCRVGGPGAPDTGDNITICGGKAVSMAADGDVFLAGNVTVQTNATLRTDDNLLELGSGDTLSVPGTLEVEASGTVNLIGSASRSISGVLVVDGTFDVQGGTLEFSNTSAAAYTINDTFKLSGATSKLSITGTG